MSGWERVWRRRTEGEEGRETSIVRPYIRGKRVDGIIKLYLKVKVSWILRKICALNENTKAE